MNDQATRSGDYWARIDGAWQIVHAEAAGNWVEFLGGDEIIHQGQVEEWGPEVVRPEGLVDRPPAPPPFMPSFATQRAIKARGYTVCRPGLPITLLPLNEADPLAVVCDTEEDLAEWLRATKRKTP